MHLCEGCDGFYLVTSVLILLKKKTELAALQNSYVSCHMSFVKVTRKVPSVVLISQWIRTNGPYPESKFKFCKAVPVFCSILQSLTIRFLCQLFLRAKRCTTCPLLTLSVFSAWFSLYISWHIQYLFFLVFPHQALHNAKSKRGSAYSKYTLTPFTEPLPF